MSFKKFRRVACVVAAAAALAAAPALAGCQTSHPEANITIEFNGTEYTLNYKMYRNMYPQTVLHFIELADNGFYDNTIIHDYESSYWYAGGYSYDGENYKNDFNENGLGEYVENNSKERAYYEDMFLGGKLTSSVYLDYLDGEFKNPLPTLIGEFRDAEHTIDKGALKSSYGCLRMYYTTKDTKKEVYLDKYGTDDAVIGSYKNHSATSIFNIQVGSSTATDNDSCIFAVLQNVKVLDTLRDDISTYITTNGLSSKFTSDVSVFVDNYDMIVDKMKTTSVYTFTAEPIKVKSVKITKY